MEKQLQVCALRQVNRIKEIQYNLELRETDECDTFLPKIKDIPFVEII